MTKWQEVKLGDVCSSISDTYRRNDKEVVLINTSDVLDGKILNHSPVKNEKLKGQFKKTFQNNDILYSEIRPANKRFAFVDIPNTNNYIASTKLMVLRPNTNKILPKFLYCIFKSDDIINELQHLAETRSGTFPQITFSAELAPMEILLPPLDIQQKIAGVLSALDDKIELNNKINNNSSRVTIDNIRRILSSFFAWLEDENYIIKSPVRRIHKVKTGTNIKETYSDEMLELMRDECGNLRDLAMIDMLASTGMRVGEMVLLNREDINFTERECVVFGKGDKERIVYFDARTKIHLQNYLKSRTDSNAALFVSLKSPHNRLEISGIEVRLRELGLRLNIPKVHPHKFRRTLATMAIDKGMPIEQLQKLLGHSRIDTTLQYAMVKQSNVKLAHRKFIG